jgi:hypothetical protein
MMLILVFLIGFSWAIWYVAHARLKDQLRLLRAEITEKLSKMDQQVKQLDSSLWSTDARLGHEIASLKISVQEFMQEYEFRFPLTQEERLNLKRERIAKEVGCDPADVILNYSDFRRKHYEPLRQKPLEEPPSTTSLENEESEPKG